MRLTFLGTGTSQGIPVIGCDCTVCRSGDPRDKRLRCAALLEDANTRILIDSGPDIRYQSLRTGIKRLDGVLISHEHYDHTGGLDDLRPFIYMQNAPLQVYAQPDVINTVRIKYDYAFGNESYPGAPKFEMNAMSIGSQFKIEQVNILPLKVLHGKLGILGFKFNNRLVYITDANELPEETIQLCSGIPCLVINALHHRPHHAHFTLEETLKTIEMIQPKTTYIIHMSHHMGLHAEMEAALPGKVHFAYDTLSVPI